MFTRPVTCCTRLALPHHPATQARHHHQHHHYHTNKGQLGALLAHATQTSQNKISLKTCILSRVCLLREARGHTRTQIRAGRFLRRDTHSSRSANTDGQWRDGAREPDQPSSESAVAKNPESGGNLQPWPLARLTLLLQPTRTKHRNNLTLPQTRIQTRFSSTVVNEKTCGHHALSVRVQAWWRGRGENGNRGSEARLGVIMLSGDHLHLYQHGHGTARLTPPPPPPLPGVP